MPSEIERMDALVNQRGANPEQSQTDHSNESENVEIDEGLDTIEETESDNVEEVGIDGIDREDLTPDMQEKYDQMVKGMNAKFREAAEIRKSAESDSQKAKTLDEMMRNPEKLKAFVDAMNGSANKSGEGNDVAGSVLFGKYADVDVSEIYQEEDLQGISAVVYKLFREEMAPLVDSFKPYLQYIENHAASQQTKQWTDIAEKYPAVADKKAEVEKMMATGLSLKQAVFAVGGEDLLKTPSETSSPKKAPREPRTQLTKPTVNASSNGAPKGTGYRAEVDRIFEEFRSQR